VLNLLRGLNPKYRYVKPVITAKYPPHTFMSACSFLMLEEVSVQHDVAVEATQALTATHGDQSSGASSGNKEGSSSGAPRRDNRSTNGNGNSRSNNRSDRRRGRNNGNGGGSRSNTSNTQSGPWNVAHNPWQGLVQA
jgi:hypothetical protein